MAGGVPGRANNLPVGVAESKDLPVVEWHVDGVGADRLVEVLRLAAAGSRRARAWASGALAAMPAPIA